MPELVEPPAKAQENYFALQIYDEDERSWKDLMTGREQSSATHWIAHAHGLDQAWRVVARTELVLAESE